jgi:hypothetical protein
MAHQTITITAPIFSDEGTLNLDHNKPAMDSGRHEGAAASEDAPTMTISLDIEDEKLVRILGRDSTGRRFRGSLAFEEDDESLTYDTKGHCCCWVEDGGRMVCKPGPCYPHGHGHH